MPQRAVPAKRDQRLAVGRKCPTLDHGLFSSYRAELLAGVHVPQAHQAAAPPGPQGAAIGGEGDLIDTPGTCPPAAKFLARARFPNGNRAIVVSRYQGLAVERVDDGAQIVFALSELAHFLAGGDF